MSQNSGRQSPRKLGSVLRMIWLTDWTRWPHGLPSNLSDPMITVSLGLHVRKVFSCMKDCETSSLFAKFMHLLNYTCWSQNFKHFWTIFTIYWRNFPMVITGFSFTWGFWWTDTASIVLGLVCLPAGKTSNMLLRGKKSSQGTQTN